VLGACKAEPLPCRRRQSENPAPPCWGLIVKPAAPPVLLPLPQFRDGGQWIDSIHQASPSVSGLRHLFAADHDRQGKISRHSALVGISAVRWSAARRSRRGSSAQAAGEGAVIVGVRDRSLRTRDARHIVPWRPRCRFRVGCRGLSERLSHRHRLVA